MAKFTERLRKAFEPSAETRANRAARNIARKEALAEERKAYVEESKIAAKKYGREKARRDLERSHEGFFGAIRPAIQSVAKETRGYAEHRGYAKPRRKRYYDEYEDEYRRPRRKRYPSRRYGYPRRRRYDYEDVPIRSKRFKKHRARRHYSSMGKSYFGETGNLFGQSSIHRQSDDVFRRTI